MGVQCCPHHGGGTGQGAAVGDIPGALVGAPPMPKMLLPCTREGLWAGGWEHCMLRAGISHLCLFGPRCQMFLGEGGSCWNKVLLSAGDTGAVNDSGILHTGLLFFFFLGRCRIFSPPWTFQSCCSAEEWHFQDKAAPRPPAEAAKLGVCVCCFISNVTGHLHTQILCLALAGSCCSFLFPFYSAC